MRMSNVNPERDGFIISCVRALIRHIKANGVLAFRADHEVESDSKVIDLTAFMVA